MFIKNPFCITFLLFIQTAFISAAIYYVSPNGNDGNSGTSIGPTGSWQTINKVNSMMSSFAPGDSVLFERGGVYTGNIIVGVSGSAGNPIVIAAYGSGNNPVITGAQSIGSWQSIGNSIWKSPYVKRPQALYINDVPQQIARYPNPGAANGGYLTYSSYSGTTTITSSSTLANIWAGGEAVVRIKHYDLERLTISSQSGAGNKNINFSTSPRISPFTNNYGFFLQNDTNALDQQGEWCFQNGNLYLYYSTNPGSSVSVSSYTYNITCKSHNYITIQNLTLEDADSSNVFINAASNFSVISCNLRQPGINGIYIKRSSPYCVIQNNVINNIPNDAIYTYTNSSQHMLVENNKITRIGLLPGMGAFDGGEREYAGIIFDGTGSICRYNYIDSVGCNGIDCWTNADSMVIQNNYISHCEMVQDDNAAIHSIIAAGVNYNTRTITGNILLNGVGAPYGTSNSFDNGFTHGIYLDQRTTKYRITGNTIANMPGSGILLHGTNKDTISGNTLFNNGTSAYNSLPNAQISLRDAGAQGGYNDSAIVVSKNILVSMDSIQKVLALLEVTNTGNACTTYALYDSNYYCQPFLDTNHIFYVNDITSSLNTHYSLQQWKIYSMEVFANPAPIYYQNWSTATNNVLFFYNAGQSIQTYSLPSGNTYIDVKSNPYSSTVQINPYSSIVLFYVGTTGIKETKNNIPNQLTIYPNPTNDKIYFGNVPSSISNLSIDVYSSLGEKILSKSINLQTEKTLDVANLLQGAYFVHLTNESTTTNYKIVIIR